MEAILAKELKAWQKEFRSKNGGREPTRADMAKHPTMASTYDTWHALRKEAKGRGNGSSSSSSSSNSKPPSKSLRTTKAKPLANPFKTPTKPRASSSSFPGPYSRTPTAATTPSSSSRQPRPMEPFRTPSKPSSTTSSQQSHASRTPGSAGSLVHPKVFYPPQPVVPHSPAAASPSRLREQIGKLSSSGFTNTPRHRFASDAMLLEDLTPRTKARKRLRGEEVPMTPARAKKTRKRFGGAALSALDEGSGSDGSADVAAGRGAGRPRPLQRKVSAFGMARMREAESQERASAVVEEEEEDEEIQPSPSKPLAVPQQARGAYKPLLGLRGELYDQELDADGDHSMRDPSPSSSSGSRNAASHSVSRSRSRSSHSPHTAGTSPLSAADGKRSLARTSSKSFQPRVWTAVVSDEEQEGGAGQATGTQSTTTTTITIRPYQHYGDIDQREREREGSDDDGDHHAALARQRTTAAALTPSLPPSSAPLTLSGLTLRSPSSKARAAREAERRAARAHLRSLHVLSEREATSRPADADAEVRLLEQAAQAQARVLSAEALAEGARTVDEEAWSAPLAAKGRSWGEAKAGARVEGEAGVRSKGRPSGKARAQAATLEAKKREDEEALLRVGRGGQVLRRVGRGDEECDEEGSEEETQQGQGGSDEDWDSEVESDEYGLGDGRMDTQDVM